MSAGRAWRPAITRATLVLGAVVAIVLIPVHKRLGPMLDRLYDRPLVRDLLPSEAGPRSTETHRAGEP